MKILTEVDIIRIMREEWQKKVDALTEDVNVAMNAKVDGEKKNVIAPELKVKHKKSGLLYTIDSISMNDVVLRAPKGTKFIIDVSTFEDEYILD